MSTDTKAIIRKGVSLEEIKTALEKKYTEVEVNNGGSSEMFRITFKDNDVQRMIWVFYSGSCVRDCGIDGVWLSLGLWGNSIEIMRYLCEEFGGYIDENDCDDEGFEPVNIELYENGEDFTPMDKFRNKIISELGYKNLNKALNLFEEFKTIA
jgi:hypothetical protein